MVEKFEPENKFDLYHIRIFLWNKVNLEIGNIKVTLAPISLSLNNNSLQRHKEFSQKEKKKEFAMEDKSKWGTLVQKMKYVANVLEQYGT